MSSDACLRASKFWLEFSDDKRSKIIRFSEIQRSLTIIFDILSCRILHIDLSSINFLSQVDREIYGHFIFCLVYIPLHHVLFFDSITCPLIFSPNYFFSNRDFRVFQRADGAFMEVLEDFREICRSALKCFMVFQEFKWFPGGFKDILGLYREVSWSLGKLLGILGGLGFSDSFEETLRRFRRVS